MRNHQTSLTHVSQILLGTKLSSCRHKDVCIFDTSFSFNIFTTTSVSSLHASDDDYDDGQGMITASDEITDDRSDETVTPDREKPSSDGNADPQ